MLSQSNHGQTKVALRVEDVAELLAVSERHIWTLVAQGKFPKPFKLGASSRWLSEEVVEFCRAQSGRATSVQ